MPQDRAHPQSVVETGSAIGPYRITGVMANGPSGTIYDATEATTGRRVALRHLPERLAHNSVPLEQFLKAAGKGLRHPNVVAADGVERHGDEIYLIMEFVGGRPVETSGGRMPWRVATRIARDAARGLAAIHAAGLVHGQIKPRHLIVANDGVVKLTDLGMASLDETPVNPVCAAPELVRGHPPDARTDLYALGATYFTLLTSRPPFAEAGNPIDVYDAILHRPVPTVRAAAQETPLRCDAIVQRAMAKDPAERYQSAELLLADLDALLATDEPARPRPILLPKLRRPPAWRQPRVLLGALVLLLGLAAAGWYVFGPSDSITIPILKKSAQPSRTTIVNSIGMPLMSVRAGRFLMGDSTVPDARPPHVVRITRRFLIGATEVTQAEYQQVMGDNPSYFPGDHRPVDSVTWDDAVAFCEKLSARAGEQSAGRAYRLPTEAEWEYACRAGTDTAFSLGSTLPGGKANSVQSGFLTTIDVGILPANPWGLYDVHGNVAEWCHDWYGIEYYAVTNPIDPTGPATGLRRVARGGSWASEPAECRSGARASFAPEERSPSVGFRVVCVVEGER